MVVVSRCAVALAALFTALSSCRAERTVDLDFSRRDPSPVGTIPTPDTLRVAVGAMLSPEATYGAYDGLVSILAERVGRRHELVQRRTYEEINRLLLNGEVDLAFVCTGAYVPIRERVRFLAAPVIDGSASYRSYIVTRTGGPATLEALRGTRFAFTDPLSNTGRLYPVYLLRTRFEMGPRQFFSETVYTGGHDESLRVLLEGAVDAAAVDGAVFDAYARAHSADLARLAVIHRSPPFGSPPFIARLDLDRSVSDAVRDALLHFHEDPSSRALLAGLGIQRFVPEADYSLAVRVADIARGAAGTGPTSETLP